MNRERARRQGIVRILAAVLCAALALALGASVPAIAQPAMREGRSGSEEPATGEWQAFKDPRGYAFEYPADWNLASTAPDSGTCPVMGLYSWSAWDEPGAYWLEPPPGERIVEIYSFANPEQLTSGALAVVDAQMSGYSIVSGGEVPVGAMVGWEQVWEQAGRSAASVFLGVGGRALVIHIYPASQWQAPEIQHLLDNLTLTAPESELQPFPQVNGVLPGPESEAALVQPPMKFPWPGDETWYYTGGPHASWTPGVRSGIDFAPGPSHRTVAVAPGEITYAGYMGGGSGCAVKLRHPNGWNTWYLHLADWSVEPPEQVGQGEDIGTTGGSGGWPIHIHVELLRNDVDHETWHGKEFDGWQVHQDCQGYTGYDPKGTCSPTNYDGYIHHIQTGRQVIPWVPADQYQTVTSTNDPFAVRVKTFDNGLPVPWYYLFEASDSRVVAVGLDGEWLFEAPAYCAYQGWVDPGSHNLALYYEIGGEVAPAIRVASWPFEAPSCATEPRDPPRPDIGPAPCTSQATLEATVAGPDGILVSPGQVVSKTWRVRNSGTCPWVGYRLEFASGEPMGAPSSVIIPATMPSEEVDLPMALVAPTTQGDHAGYRQIVDTRGAWVDGGLLRTLVRVAEPSPALRLYVDPPSPSNAGDVTICGYADGLAGTRAMRVVVDGQIVAESATPTITYTWDTLAYEEGAHAILVQAATWADPGWAYPEQAGMAYELLPDREAANHAPYPPLLTSPDDHFVTATIPALCAASTGDPEDDGVTAFQFEVEGPTAWTSEWIAAPYTCTTPTSLAPGAYVWRARARDQHGHVSDWSGTNDFTRIGGVTITAFEFDVPSPSAAEEVRIHTDGDAPTGETLVQVNEAGDGTTHGAWISVNHVSGTLAVDSLWQTLDATDGDHVVRVTIHTPDGTGVAEETYSLLHRRPKIPHPVTPAADVWVTARTVGFQWESALRSDSYQLVVSDEPNPEDDPTPLLDITFYTETLSHEHSFGTDYQDLYWSVRASNDVGTSGEGSNYHFGIDEDPPTASVSPLLSTTTGLTLTVNWSGGDARSGLRRYDVQVRDGTRGEWVDWTGNRDDTVAIFHAQPGHTYYLQARAMDEAGNWASYAGGDGDTHTRVEAPLPRWWDADYAHKRNLILANGDSGAMDSPYPVHLHLDATTIPTADEVYNASLATIKGADVRVVYQDRIELDRMVQAFSTARVNIWFPLYAGLAGGQLDRTSYQLYYGNAAADAPPEDPNVVFLPTADEHTVGLWHFQEGAGATVHDGSGQGHDGVFDTPGWTEEGRFGYAGDFDGASSYVDLGYDPAFDLVTMTLEGWIALDGVTAEGSYLFDKEQYWVRVTGERQVEFGVRNDGGTCAVTSTRSLALDTWVHVAATHDGESVLRVYVDGVLEGERTDSWPAANSDAPFRIGWTGNYTDGGYFSGRVHHVSVSDVAREAFPGTGLQVDPEVMVGPLVPPPGAGEVDLEVQSLAVYPADGALDGDWAVSALVRNVGEAPAADGFASDLYIDHEPAGPGDLTGSVRFWLASPLEVGATLTLTALLDDLGRDGGPNASLPSPPVESSVTLYLQADSEGAVAEPDEANNISPGAGVCIAAADVYEGDDEFDRATPLDVAGSRAHNLHVLGDEDWFRLEAEAGVTYTFLTTGLGPRADTVLSLYDSDGATLLASNDDCDDSLASCLEWVAPQDGPYYLQVKHWNPSVAGCGTGYSVLLDYLRFYVPVMLRSSEGP